MPFRDTEMPFLEFLQLTKTIKLLYGRDYACEFFEKNYKEFYDLNDMFMDSETLKNGLQSSNPLIH